MCDVCRCELPINRSGHVTREVRRIHREGAKHQQALQRQGEQEQRQLERWREEWAEEDRQARLQRVHALALGLLITRLRAKHGSIAEARDAWAHEADARLNALDMPSLKVKLLGKAKQQMALTEMRELMYTQDHELLRILMQHLGWD